VADAFKHWRVHRGDESRAVHISDLVRSNDMSDKSLSQRLRILVVDDEANIRRTLSMYLESEGHLVTGVSNSEDAMREANQRPFDVAFVDLRLGTTSGLDLIPLLLSASPWAKIVVITAYASIDTAVEAMRRGAADYLPKPFTPVQVGLVLQKATEIRSLERKVDSLLQDLDRSNPEVSFLTEDPVMQRIVHLAQQVADSDATILLRGESGTGKTVLARNIHRWSSRSAMPFGVISCPSLSAELLDSEMFGHVRGAFTGAVRDNPGRIAASEGGTLLLDEIGDLPLSLQPKLLRFLQDKEYERVGDYATRKADVRILAATNVNLEDAVRRGLFREDLLYRLNVIQIEIPPLRERPSDIRALAERLLAFFSHTTHRTFLGFSSDAFDALIGYSWPGNVRELRNAIERAAILCHAERIGVDCLPEKVQPSPATSPRVGDPVRLNKIEEEHIRRVLAASKSLQEAADILGIDQATLWRRRKQYGI
jgi:two-component system, NtrC family, response regulator AlgB